MHAASRLSPRSSRAGITALSVLTALSVIATDIAAASPPASTSAPEEDAASHSASLAGVARWADAEPADLGAAATYRLPGFIDRDITLDNLRRRFGAANVRVAQIDGAEGETSKGIVLFADDPARRAELVYRDQERSRGIESVRVRGERSRWQLDDGVHIGMTLADLVRLNGAPVSFNGLDWDYGGTVTDWHAGKAARDARGPVFRSVSLDHAENARGYPIGEGTFSSGDPRYPKQGTVLVVGEIGVTFEADGD